MFKQNISFEVWGGENGKYRLLDDDKNPIDKTPEDTCDRVAKALSDLELPDKREFWYKEFRSILGTRFAGGGRIMANVGAGQYKKETSPINCFVKGTMVATSEGNKKIEDVKVGDLVLTHNGRFKKVTQTFCNPLSDRTVFSIKAFRTPEIKVTGNHKFLSLSKEQMDWGYTDPQWNTIEYLRVGDYIAIPNNFQELDYVKQINIYDEVLLLPSADIDWFEIKDLGDKAQISTIRKNKNLQKHQSVNKIWNIDEDFAFFLGLWYGDGCVYSMNSDDPKLRGITFTFHANEKENINFVANYGEKLFGLKADVNDNSESDNSVQIRFHSTLVGYVFNKLFGRYFDKKFMYKEVYKWPTNLYYKLLAGLISSDGTITGAGDIRVVLANRQLIMDFYIAGRMNNIPVGYSETEDTRNHHPTARLDIPRYNDLIDLTQRVYDDDRVQIARDRGDDNFIKKYGNYTLVKLNIKKAVNITDDNVYTLEVEDDHSYTVSGLICQNCTVMKQIPDSMAGIMDVAKDAALTLKAGCGVGYDFSTIRPKGSHVFGAGAGTSGVISFMKIFDAICSTILSGGARRGAQMACLDIQSPEIEDFITAKRQDGVLRYFNCSVLVTDRFMQAVEEDKEWDLWFWEKDRSQNVISSKDVCLIKQNDIPYNHPEFKYFQFAEDHCEVEYGNCTKDTVFKKRIFKTVKAKELYDLIMRSTYNFWEPGFLLVDRANIENNLYFCEIFRATNPCAEQWLFFLNSCLLGSNILTFYVKAPCSNISTPGLLGALENFDLDQFRSDVKIISRLLDNVVELNNLPLAGLREQILLNRRHGLGFTGLGSALNMLGLAYGTDDSLEFAEKIALINAQESLVANIDLAKEKGCAPIFDSKESREAVLKSVYLQRLINTFENKKQIIKDILEFGLRYSHATSVAPTGTLSLTWGNNCSGGIEPEIANSYFRNIRDPNKKTKTQEEVLSYSYFIWKEKCKEMGVERKLPDYWRTAKDLTVMDHLRMQAVVQKWVDSSISKTINVPADYPFEDFKKIYLEGWKLGLKGVTTYRPNASIGAGVLTQKSDLDATTYTFMLEDGREVSFLGSEMVEYDGESHNVANLYDALKEGIYGSM